MLSYNVIERRRPLEKGKRETPKPHGTEVLLRLKYCGVCHSDVHIRDGYFELGGGKHLRMSERGMNLPVTMGHEPYGTIIDAAPKAGAVPIGADRLVYPGRAAATASVAPFPDDFIYFVIFGTLVWLTRNGFLASILAGLLVPDHKTKEAYYAQS
jgi:NADPH:quinone reductase-like Zn-dependent oxidoreductase